MQQACQTLLSLQHSSCKATQALLGLSSCCTVAGPSLRQTLHALSPLTRAGLHSHQGWQVPSALLQARHQQLSHAVAACRIWAGLGHDGSHVQEGQRLRHSLICRQPALSTCGACWVLTHPAILTSGPPACSEAGSGGVGSRLCICLCAALSGCGGQNCGLFMVPAVPELFEGQACSGACQQTGCRLVDRNVRSDRHTLCLCWSTKGAPQP